MGYNDFLKKIRESYQKLTPREKKVADYIMKDYKTAAFLNCVKLGKAVGVSDTTVIRLANSLDFNGFTEMKNTLQDIVKEEVSPKEKLTETISSVEESSYLKGVYEQEKQNLESTYNLIDSAELELVVNTICKARKIFIMGLGTSSCTVRFLTSRLRRVGKDVIEINSSAYSLVEKSTLLSGEDVFMAFDFARYSNDVLKMIRYAKEEFNTHTILVTASLQNPSLEYADHQILVRNDTLAFTNSIVGSDFIANLISVGVVLKEKDNSVNQIAKNEQFAKILGHSI